MDVFQNRIDFFSLKTVAAGATDVCGENGSIPTLNVIVSGYEERSSSWGRRRLEAVGVSEANRYLLIGFSDYATVLSRHSNDELYASHGLEQVSVDSGDWQQLEAAVGSSVQELLAEAGETTVEIHVDYSSMPRLWYCSLPQLLARILRPLDTIYFWYTPGHYPRVNYPTAGIKDFHIFAGGPSGGPLGRTHLFGLGFDRIRSRAIWSIVDPERLVCFYADPGTEPEYVTRVRKDNRHVLRAADHVFTVPLRDFVFTFSQISAVTYDFQRYGDVILVPDGPKPLILAASLIPYRQGMRGVTCYHVARRKVEEPRLVDVPPADEPVGFSFNPLPADQSSSLAGLHSALLTSCLDVDCCSGCSEE